MPQSESRPQDIPATALALFERGRAAALEGNHTLARRLLLEAWTLPHHGQVRGAIAWGLGCLLVQEQEYEQAANWFACASIDSAHAAQLWPFAQATLVEHFQAIGRPLERERGGARSAGLPTLTITSLGRFEVARGGVTLPACNTRKALAILRYLLTRPQRSAHKDELAELLWPQAGAQEAAHSLHVAVAALRRYLDPPSASYLVFEAGRYTLAPDASILDDAQQFQRQLDEADQRWRTGDEGGARHALAGAIACYSGDYYVDVRDGAWALVERERLLSRYLAALDRLGRLLLARSQPEDASECFRLLLERDGYREDSCANLMRCYLALGRRHEAIRQYDACRTLLRDELDLEPGDELRHLYDDIVG